MTSEATPVTASIAIGPGVFTGTLTAVAEAGVARFTNLAINLKGSEYILSFVSGIVALNNTVTVSTAVQRFGTHDSDLAHI